MHSLSPRRKLPAGRGGRRLCRRGTAWRDRDRRPPRTNPRRRRCGPSSGSLPFIAHLTSGLLAIARAIRLASDSFRAAHRDRHDLRRAFAVGGDLIGERLADFVKRHRERHDVARGGSCSRRSRRKRGSRPCRWCRVIVHRHRIEVASVIDARIFRSARRRCPRRSSDTPASSRAAQTHDIRGPIMPLPLQTPAIVIVSRPILMRWPRTCVSSRWSGSRRRIAARALPIAETSPPRR